jgi:uncharacterized integral membrane protein
VLVVSVLASGLLFFIIFLVLRGLSILCGTPLTLLPGTLLLLLIIAFLLLVIAGDEARAAPFFVRLIGLKDCLRRRTASSTPREPP